MNSEYEPGIFKLFNEKNINPDPISNIFLAPIGIAKDTISALFEKL